MNSMVSTTVDLTMAAELVASKPALSREINGHAINDDELAILVKMNEQYTQVRIGGKHRVFSKTYCQVNGKGFAISTLGDFNDNFTHLSKIANISRGSAWQSWASKSFKPDGVGFFPNEEECPDSVFNVYMGFGSKAIEGDVQPYLNHLKNVICDGNHEAYTYLIGWLAHLVQKPTEKPSVGILMKSVEGTGKGTLTKPLIEIFAAHSLETIGYESITGKFNSALNQKLLVFVDEVTLSAGKSAAKIKGLISESRMMIEYKGLDSVPSVNLCRFIFATNEDRAITAGLRERRYLFLEPNPEQAQDKGYFDALYAWIENGGSAALLHYLGHYDLTGFDPRRAPVTKGLIQEKLKSLRLPEQYIYEQTISPEPFANRIGTHPLKAPELIGASELVEHYLAWVKENSSEDIPNIPAARSSIGQLMKKLEIPVTGRSDRGDGKQYKLPSRNKLQTEFAQMLGHEVDDIYPTQ